MKRFRFVILAAVILAGALLFSVTSPVLAAIDEASKQAACEGLGAAGPGCNGAEAGSAVEGLVETVISILSLVVGIAAVIMIIVGGFKYVTSNGDSNGISSAKSTIIYALIGLAIAALAQIIVRYVLDATT